MSLIAAGVVLLLVRKPRRIGWPIGVVLFAASLLLFIYFTDLIGACAD